MKKILFFILILPLLFPSLVRSFVVSHDDIYIQVNGRSVRDNSVVVVEGHRVEVCERGKCEARHVDDNLILKLNHEDDFITKEEWYNEYYKERCGSLSLRELERKEFESFDYDLGMDQSFAVSNDCGIYPNTKYAYVEYLKSKSVLQHNLSLPKPVPVSKPDELYIGGSTGETREFDYDIANGRFRRKQTLFQSYVKKVRFWLDFAFLVFFGIS